VVVVVVVVVVAVAVVKLSASTAARLGGEMSKYCDDCGTRMWGNACPNCHEEYCIEQEQGEFIERRSDEWIQKVEEQKEQIEAKQ